MTTNEWSRNLRVTKSFLTLTFSCIIFQQFGDSGNTALQDLKINCSFRIKAMFPLLPILAGSFSFSRVASLNIANKLTTISLRLPATVERSNLEFSLLVTVNVLLLFWSKTCSFISEQMVFLRNLKRMGNFINRTCTLLCRANQEGVALG